jgi:hypothetical protein
MPLPEAAGRDELAEELRRLTPTRSTARRWRHGRDHPI